MTEREIINLSGYELDKAVLIALGFKTDKELKWLSTDPATGISFLNDNYHPTTNGTQCMAIMEREKISVAPCAQNLWEAEFVDNEHGFITAQGKTASEAILRCFLFKKNSLSMIRVLLKNMDTSTENTEESK